MRKPRAEPGSSDADSSSGARQMPAVARKLGHRPALDGVRALAILGVMAIHADDRLFRGGFYGVDVFFALSSFLITSLIYEELSIRGGRYSFFSFYVRRALRLCPALVLWLLAIAAPTAVVLHQTEHIPLSTLVALSYTTNVALAAGEHVADPYLHAWSLSVEEQFYIVWPAIVVFALAVRRVAVQRRILVVWCLVAAAIMYLSATTVSASYYLPTGHLVPLAAGSLAACLFAFEGWGRLVAAASSAAAGVGALGLLIGVFVLYRSVGALPGLLIGVTTSLAAVSLILGAALEPRSPAARLLSSRVAVYIGRRSYGLYLYHRTLSALIPALIPGITLKVAGPSALAVSFLVAEASFRFVERPAHRRGREWLRRRRQPARAAEFGLPLSPKVAKGGNAPVAEAAT